MPLSPGAQDIADRMPQTGWWFPSPYSPSLFPDGGGHILMKSASSRISIVLRRVGISDPKITGHSLRHFYATWLLSNEVPIHIVQHLMGHASLATTQLYALVTDRDKLNAVAELPRLGEQSVDAQPASSQLATRHN